MHDHFEYDVQVRDCALATKIRHHSKVKQIVQNYRSGELWLEEIPTPICRSGSVLVRNEYSVVSTGTERMKVDQARMNLLEKAKERPDQVRKVLQSVSQVGLKETFDKVQERLDALTTLGYSSVGIIESVGKGIDHLKPGDRVVCAGEGIACHAEYVCVPKNLCALVPRGVDAREAAFATIGAIAMNGVRQSQVTLGDSVAVIGLGLVGLLAVQILNAAGCRVIGIDVAQDKLELARLCGAEAALLRNDAGLHATIEELTSQRGVDAVYVAASAKSSDPLDLAGQIVRDRGNVVIVGMVPIAADWREYYAKELNVILSRSYGPGRYDPNFENKGIDYPVGYVPWTQQRNLAEFVRLVQAGLVTPTKFGATEWDFERAPEAYSALHENPGAHAGGILFRYPQGDNNPVRVVRSTDGPAKNSSTGSDQAGIAMIGAGNFATGTLIPALKNSGNARLVGICSAGGLSAKGAADRHGFEYATSEIDQILSDDNVQGVIIATRHDTHADFAIRALNSGKHVFVEKPLALNASDLEDVIKAANNSGRVLFPGYNRRFSPLAVAVREHFASAGGPLACVCRINAGAIESDSWYQDPEVGGWRIVSEGCHWIDLMSYLMRANADSVSAVSVSGTTPRKPERQLHREPHLQQWLYWHTHLCGEW